MTDQQITAEAERLANLTPDGLRTEALKVGLRLGEQSDRAANELAALDRQMLADVCGFGETRDGI